jgi:hypothetical protein
MRHVGGFQPAAPFGAVAAREDGRQHAIRLPGSRCAPGRLAKRGSWKMSGFSIASARPCQNFSGEDMCSAIHLPSPHSST